MDSLDRSQWCCLGHKGYSEYYETVLRRLDMDSSWKLLFEALYGHGGFEAPFNWMNKSSEDTLAQLRASFACSLCVVWTDVYDANLRWERNHITPGWFLYLVDRLMVSLMELQVCCCLLYLLLLNGLSIMDGRWDLAQIQWVPIMKSWRPLISFWLAKFKSFSWRIMKLWHGWQKLAAIRGTTFLCY